MAPLGLQFLKVMVYTEPLNLMHFCIANAVLWGKWSINYWKQTPHKLQMKMEFVYLLWDAILLMFERRWGRQPKYNPHLVQHDKNHSLPYRSIWYQTFLRGPTYQTDDNVRLVAIRFVTDGIAMCAGHSSGWRIGFSEILGPLVRSCYPTPGAIRS